MQTAYDIAVKTEDDGYRLYTQALERSTHPLGREILAFLAKEELKHAAIIRQMTAKLAGGGRYERSDITSDAKSGETIFSSALKDPQAHIQGAEGDIETLRTAVQFETYGIAFFAKAAQNASNPEEKKFFEAMSREERAHRQLLESGIEYLENPEAWFDRDAHIHLDGA